MCDLGQVQNDPLFNQVTEVVMFAAGCGQSPDLCPLSTCSSECFSACLLLEDAL